MAGDIYRANQRTGFFDTVTDTINQMRLKKKAQDDLNLIMDAFKKSSGAMSSIPTEREQPYEIPNPLAKKQPPLDMDAITGININQTPQIPLRPEATQSNVPETITSVGKVAIPQKERYYQAQDAANKFLLDALSNANLAPEAAQRAGQLFDVLGSTAQRYKPTTKSLQEFDPAKDLVQLDNEGNLQVIRRGTPKAEGQNVTIEADRDYPELGIKQGELMVASWDKQTKRYTPIGKAKDTSAETARHNRTMENLQSKRIDQEKYTDTSKESREVGSVEAQIENLNNYFSAKDNKNNFVNRINDKDNDDYGKWVFNGAIYSTPIVKILIAQKKAELEAQLKGAKKGLSSKTYFKYGRDLKNVKQAMLDGINTGLNPEESLSEIIKANPHLKLTDKERNKLLNEIAVE